MEFAEFEVMFSKYCAKCKYKKTPETEDPCNECLEYGFNYNTEKPRFFEEADSK